MDADARFLHRRGEGAGGEGAVWAVSSPRGREVATAASRVAPGGGPRVQLPSEGRSDGGPPSFVSGVGSTDGAGLGPGLTSCPGTVLPAWGGGAYISAGRRSPEVFGAPDRGSPAHG